MFEEPFGWLDISICCFDSLNLTAVANRTGKKLLCGNYIFNTLPIILSNPH
jgi:hypothetical protein